MCRARPTWAAILACCPDRPRSTRAGKRLAAPGVRRSPPGADSDCRTCSMRPRPAGSRPSGRSATTCCCRTHTHWRRRGRWIGSSCVIVQDLFMTATARRFADVFLPACSSFEKEGTFMNAERRIQRVRRVMPPAGASKPDWQILCAVARAMGRGEAFAYDSAEDDLERGASGLRGRARDVLRETGNGGAAVALSGRVAPGYADSARDVVRRRVHAPRSLRSRPVLRPKRPRRPSRSC